MTDARRQSLQLPGYDPFRDAEDGSGYYFDEPSAQLAIDFVESQLTFTKGEWEGEPFILAPWQKWPIVGNLFGWKREGGKRRYRQTLIYLPRKNGKSELCAAIGHVMLFLGNIEDGGKNKPEGAPEIHCVATEKKQAGLVHEAARRMIRANPSLAEMCRVTDFYMYIRLHTGGIWEVLSGEKGGGGRGQGKHGTSPYCVIVDELHEMMRPDLLEAEESGMGGRQQPLILLATTADVVRPSLCNQRVDYARQVRDGSLRDGTFLPVMYETADRDCDWADPAIWAAANPMYPVTPNHEFMVAESNKAKGLPSYENTFRRLYLNQQTEQASRWLPMSDWKECSEPFDQADLEGQTCYAGLDLASTNDLNALALWFPDPQVLLMRYWLPEAAIDDADPKRDGSLVRQYREWRRDGYLLTTPGDYVDHDEITSAIFDMAELYNMIDLRYDDRYASQMATHLREGRHPDGRDVNPVEAMKFNQSATAYNEPSLEFERMVRSHAFNHLDNPVLTWNAANVAIKHHGDLIMPARPEATSTLKIDGIPAAIMAIAGDMFNIEDGGDFEIFGF